MDYCTNIISIKSSNSNIIKAVEAFIQDEKWDCSIDCSKSDCLQFTMYSKWTMPMEELVILSDPFIDTDIEIIVYSSDPIHWYHEIAVFSDNHWEFNLISEYASKSNK
jgi:hypothetical protein